MWRTLFSFVIVATFVVSPAYAREAAQRGGGGGFDAFANLIGSGGWMAAGKTVGRDDIARMHQGPSQLRILGGDEIMTSYTRPFSNVEGFDLGSIEVTTNRMRHVNAGISFSQFQVGGIREAVNGALTGNTFNASMSAIALSLAPPRTGRMGYGVQLNYFNVSIRERSTSRMSLDLGADYSAGSAKIIGNIRNLLAERGGANAMLMMGELRGEWSPYEQLHLGVTGTYRENGEANIQLGAQYDLFKFLSIMGGYVGNSRQWTTGVKSDYNGISLQYGLTGHRELDFSHTISLGYEFGGSRAPRNGAVLGDEQNLQTYNSSRARISK